MYDTGFCRIERIQFAFVAISLIVASNLSCSFFNEDVNCKSKLTLKIINNTKSAKKIEFSNFKEDYNPDFVNITYKDSTASIAQNEQKNFIFEYSWIGSGECVFSKGLFEDYRIDVNVSGTDSTMLHYQVYPFDTTNEFQTVCTGCVHEYFDTLVLEDHYNLSVLVADSPEGPSKIEWERLLSK